MVRSLRPRPYNSPLAIRSIDAPAAPAGKVAGKDSVLVIIDDPIARTHGLIIDSLLEAGATVLAVAIGPNPPVEYHRPHPFADCIREIKTHSYEVTGNRKQRRAQQRGR